MNSAFIEFRDILATIAEAGADLDYIPVRNEEGFITLDEFACHYIHDESERGPTLRLFLLKGEETITSKCDAPSFIYYWTGTTWNCPDHQGCPDVSSEGLAKTCLKHLFDLAKEQSSNNL